MDINEIKKILLKGTIDDNILLEKQIEAAKNLVKIFVNYGIASEIIAEFENLL